MVSAVIGGAGFIGTHLVKRLRENEKCYVVDLQQGDDAKHTSGLAWFLASRHVETVYHLASNPDIAAAVENPMIDFDNGTAITASVCEASRLANVRKIVYASGSGVYGDRDNNIRWAHEDDGPLEPVSPYGASKLAGEALVSAYFHMFGIAGISFRFANVVGPGQTHGVGLDFINRLRHDPEHLTVLGDGKQSKSYVHVDDVVDAIGIAVKHTHDYRVFNVATEQALKVSEIAALATEVRGCDPLIRYTGGRGGWAGDVPVVKLDSGRIRALGWKPKWTSHDAMLDAMRSM